MSNDSPPSTYDQQIMLSGFTEAGSLVRLVTGQSSAKVKQLTEPALQVGATQLPLCLHGLQ